MKNVKLNSLVILPINLQLFADKGDDDSDNQPGVVDQDDDYQDDDSDDNSDDFDSDDSDEFDDDDIYDDDSSGTGDSADDKQKKPDVADPDKSKQTPEVNSQFQKMRAKAKAEALKELETERSKIDAEKKELDAFRQQQRNKEIEDKYFKEVTQEAIEKFAYDENIPEEFARKHLFEQARNRAISEINVVNTRISQSQSQKAALKNKLYFRELEPKIDELISKDPNIDVETAYNYLRGVELDNLLASSSKNAEKRTIANIQDRARRKSVPSGSNDIGLDVNKVLSKDEIEMSIAFGNDPRNIAKTVRNKIREQKRR